LGVRIHAGLFVLFAVAGLFAALFFWLEPERGPAAAALISSQRAFLGAREQARGATEGRGSGLTK